MPHRRRALWCGSHRCVADVPFHCIAWRPCQLKAQRFRTRRQVSLSANAKRETIGLAQQQRTVQVQAGIRGCAERGRLAPGGETEVGPSVCVCGYRVRIAGTKPASAAAMCFRKRTANAQLADSPIQYTGWDEAALVAVARCRCDRLSTDGS